MALEMLAEPRLLTMGASAKGLPDVCFVSSVSVLPSWRSQTKLPGLCKVRAVADVSSRSAEEAARFDAVVMRTYGRYPLVMEHGKGALLYDVDGRQFLDCVAGIATCTLGHAHPALQEAVANQLGKVAHVSNLYYIPEQASLAEWIVKWSPADKVFFCNSGGEANEAAIKLTRKYWHSKNEGRENDVPVIVTAHQSFHGRTLATITATGQPKYHNQFWPMMPGFEYVTYNDISDLRRVTDAAGDRLAGILLEALQGEGGVNPGDPAFFKAARQICDERDAVLICDEVQVGVGRTGMLWGFENIGIEPDVFTTAKGLASGVPIGAMMCKQKFDVFNPGDHASTFGGNPVATAAGRVVASELTEHGLLQAARERGEQLGNRLLQIKERYPGIVSDVRGWGLIRGVEISEDAGIAASELVQLCIDWGLLLVPAGPRVVRFVPPLVISVQQIDSAVETFEKALKSLIENKGK